MFCDHYNDEDNRADGSKTEEGQEKNTKNYTSPAILLVRTCIDN